jgi:hypothetical protein
VVAETIAAVEVDLVQQPKQQKHQQYYVMMTHFAKIPRSMLFSTRQTVQHMPSRMISIIDSLKTQLLRAIRKSLLKAGQVFQTTLMLHSPTRMERLTSSKDPSTGGIMEGISMANIPRKLVKDSQAYPIVLMLQWCGVEMEKFTSIRDLNSGDSIHSSDHQ